MNALTYLTCVPKGPIVWTQLARSIAHYGQKLVTLYLRTNQVRLENLLELALILFKRVEYDGVAAYVYLFRCWR